MTTEPLDPPDAAPAEPEATEPKTGSRLGRTALLIVAGLLGGGGFGMFVTGPLVAGRVRTTAEVATPSSKEKEKEKEKEKGKEKAKEKGKEKSGEGEEGSASELPVYVLDNIVLNPAESGGLRFLLLSITLELSGPDELALVRGRDAEIREFVLVSLSRRNVEVLSDVNNRDQLKADIRSGLNVMLNGDVVSKVIFSQYVIQ